MGGTDKLTVPLDGRGSLARLLDGFREAQVVVAVGPVRDTEREVRWCREQPPGGGPLAAVAAALPLTAAPVVVIAAGDMPRLGEATAALLAPFAGGGTSGVDAAALRDRAGVRNPVAAAYRRTVLTRRLADIGPPGGMPARLLLDGLVVVDIADGEAGTDCDTWDDVDRITKELRRAR
jgi:molybdopterin-guanine dinucleotide biosynthesis protein A